MDVGDMCIIPMRAVAKLTNGTDLDTAHLRYSYKQTCVVTLTVGEVQGHEEWHLPTYDPHNQNKYHYKLHSLDLYFWTPADALQFVNGIRRVIAPSQCEILDEPGPPPRAHQPEADTSIVVQHLERVAIADSASPPTNPSAPSFAPPPAAPAFVPAPYNPAAPAAPEQIRHREKTPPPEDGDLSPLHATLAADSMTPFSPGLVPPAGYGIKGPLSPALVPPAHFQPPPGAPSFAPPPSAPPAPIPHQHPGFGSLAAAAAPTPPQQQPHPSISRAATMPVISAYSAPGAWPGSPGLPPGTPGFPPPATVPTPAPSAPPVGGFSSYSYGNPTGVQPPQQDYSIHQQLYRPTEGEMAKTERRKKLEENAGRLEKGVTGMFNKFQQRFG